MSISLLDKINEVGEDCINKFVIELEFRDDVLGGIPRTEKLIRQFLESKLKREAKDAEKKGLQPPTAAHKEELIQSYLQRMFGAETIEETIEEETQRMWTTFFQDAKGPYLGTYQVKAMLREMLSCLGIFMEKRGSKNQFQHLLSVHACDDEGNIYGTQNGSDSEEALRLHFYRDGKVLSDVDGFVDKTAHVITAQGPRSVLKRHDKVEKAKIRFAWILPARLPKNKEKAVIVDEEIAKILRFAGDDGLGCSRSQGHGSFTVTRCDKLTDNPWIS